MGRAQAAAALPPRSSGKRGREVGAIKRIDRDRAAIVEARATLSTILTTFLKEQASAIAGQVSAAIVAAAEKLAKMSRHEARALAGEIIANLDLSEWAALVPEVQQLLLTITEDGIAAGFDQLGFTPTAEITAQVNELAVTWARDRAAELVGMRYDADGMLVENSNAFWAISDSTREMLQSDVVTALEEGMSNEELAGALVARYAFSPERAEMIARTELARADVAGNMTAWRDSGIVGGKEWLLGNDHEEPDECDDAAAMGVVDIDSDFDGIGDPPAHPRCSCDVSPVLASDMDAGEAGA